MVYAKSLYDINESFQNIAETKKMKRTLALSWFEHKRARARKAELTIDKKTARRLNFTNARHTNNLTHRKQRRANITFIEEFEND